MDYKKLYNLKEAPFNLTPDPDFFFPSKTHKIALETLLYSIKSILPYGTVSDTKASKAIFINKLHSIVKNVLVPKLFNN